MHSPTASLLKKPLSDSDANREVRKMTSFILQEANEKAIEIRVRADEEYNIERAKIFRQERSLIESAHSRRLKQAELKRKVYWFMFLICIVSTAMPSIRPKLTSSP